MSAQESPSFDFEKSLSELEGIVARMERGELTLQQTLDDYERGMVLATQCQKSLQDAQQRVEILMKKHGEAALQPLAEEQAAENADGDATPQN